jgi:hypothetical protein
VRLGLRAPPISTLPVLGIVLAAGLLAVQYASQAREWAVMTDELQTSKLATSIAQTLSPVPQIHGEYYGALNQLYPLLLSPLYGSFSPPAAFDGAHVLNAFLLASSAWPAYLLGRAVSGSRAGGYFAAALTAFVPWLALSSTLLTENAAYPAFVWGLLLAYRALVEPSGRRDAAALAGLVLVYLARTQLFVLALALPIAVLGYERSLRRVVSRHRLLAVAYGGAAVVAVVLAAAGSLTRVLGNYGGTVQGNPLPAAVWRAAAVHLDDAVVATGVVPFVLGAAWSLTALLGPSRREARAFAVLFSTLVPLVTLEAASFDLRFTPGRFVQDRYVSYLAPLFAVGAAACLLERPRRSLRAALVLAAGVVFVGLAALASFGDRPVLFWASPAAAFHQALRSAAGAIGLSTDDLVRWGGLLFAALVAGALWRLPSRATVAVLGVALTAYGAFEAYYVFDWFAVPGTARPLRLEGVRRDWIDAAVPAGASVALVPSPALRAEYWWDAEFWNKTVDRALAVDGGQIYSPFAASTLSFDPKTGRGHGPEPTDLLVLDRAETRFGLAGARRIGSAPHLVLVRVARPYRAAWLVSGAEADGGIRPGRSVRIRVFGRPRELVVSVRAPFEATRIQAFTLRSGAVERSMRVPPGAVVRASVTVCVGVATFEARAPNARAVSMYLDGIRTLPRRARC